MWIVIGKTTQTLSLYRKGCPNFLELFFLLNLGIFVTASMYSVYNPSLRLHYQQFLAVVMVGSALSVFSVNVFHRAVFVFSKGLKIFPRISAKIQQGRSRLLCFPHISAKIQQGKSRLLRHHEGPNEKRNEPTHSTVTLEEDALREPLLEDSITL